MFLAASRGDGRADAEVEVKEKRWSGGCGRAGVVAVSRHLRPTNLPRKKRTGQAPTRGSARPAGSFTEPAHSMISRSHDIAARILVAEKAEQDAAVESALRRANDLLAARIDPAEVARLRGGR